MSTLKTRVIKKALLDKGFFQDNTKHEMYWFYARGKKTSIRTRISFGAKEYDDKLLSKMARQLRLNRKSLEELIECPFPE